MLKSTLAKWAFAALLAVPAVPMFAQTTHHKYVVHRTTHHTVTTTATHRHTHTRTLTHKTTRHTTYSTARHHKTVTHRTTSAHRLTHKSSVRHTSMSTTPQFKVHVTKMPPTIDGINA